MLVDKGRRPAQVVLRRDLRSAGHTFAAAVGAGALVVAALYDGLAVDDSDTPWHVADGKLLLRRLGSGHFGPVRADPFSWTARGRPWHPNAWGFDVVAAGSYRVAGWLGVSVLRLLLLGAVVAGAWWASGRLTPNRWARALAVLLVACQLPPFGALRPQLASFALLLAALGLAGRALDATRPCPSLLLLFLTIAVWAEVHGVVVAGVAAVVAAAAGHAITTRDVARPALVAATAGVAGMASPYGWTVWSYAVSARAASRNIQEWQPPSWRSSSDVLLLAGVIVAILWGLSRRRAAPWRELLPTALLTGLAFDAVRNEPLALLAALPLLAGVLDRLLTTRLAARTWRARPAGRALSPGLACTTAVAAILAFGLFVRHGSRGLDLSRLRPGAFPVRSAAVLPSGCRLLNEYDEGGFLILARPDVPVSQDGRNDLYGADLVDTQGRLLAGDGGTAALDRLGVTCVLAEPGRGLVAKLAASHSWTRLAVDSRGEAWARTATAASRR